MHTPAPTIGHDEPGRRAPIRRAPGRTQFGARNSRLGFKLKGPDTDTIKTSGVVEADFLGNQPQELAGAGRLAGGLARDRSTRARPSACGTTI